MNREPRIIYEYRERIKHMAAELSGLSTEPLGRERVLHDFLVSNDAGYENVADVLKQRCRETQGDVGVFVGAGGLFSLLPDLKLQMAVMVDTNPQVLEFNRQLANAISLSSSPKEVIDQFVYNDMDLESLRLIVRSQPALGQAWQAEAATYGADHWSNPQRFPLVKEALLSCPIAFVNSDIMNPQFNSTLADTLRSNGHNISFANLGNIAHDQTSSDYLDQWPLSETPTILYSHGVSPDSRLPMMDIVSSVDQYREAAGK